MSRPAKASEIAKEFGFTSRYWIKQAAAGKIPGARQPSGPGGNWVFDMREFRLWWSTREPEKSAQWPVYTNAERHGGVAYTEAAKNIGGPLKRDLKRSLANVLRNGSTG